MSNRLDEPKISGGQTKYTDEVADKIVESVRKGLCRKDAAALAGIGERTLYEWLDEDNPRYIPSLSQRVKEADAFAAELATSALQRAIKEGNWKAALAWLQAKRSQEWGKKERLEVANVDGQTFNTTTLTPDALKGLTEDELRQFITLQNKIAQSGSSEEGVS